MLTIHNHFPALQSELLKVYSVGVSKEWLPLTDLGGSLI